MKSSVIYNSTFSAASFPSNRPYFSTFKLKTLNNEHGIAFGERGIASGERGTASGGRETTFGKSDGASGGRGIASNGRGIASDGRGTAFDGRGTASNGHETASDLSKQAKSPVVLVAGRGKGIARQAETAGEESGISPKYYHKEADAAENSPGIVARNLPPSDEGIALREEAALMFNVVEILCDGERAVFKVMSGIPPARGGRCFLS